MKFKVKNWAEYGGPSPPGQFDLLDNARSAGGWRLSRSDLIETPKSTYAETVLWAHAIPASSADIDGLIWTSRQCDP